MKIARALTVTVALVALAGCALLPVAESPTPGVVPTLSPTPTPTPTQERETGLVAPAQVFGGDCEALFTVAELSDILGMTLTGPRKMSIADDHTPYVEEHGGVFCSWTSTTFQGGVVLVGLPEGAVDYAPPVGCDIQAEGMGSGCTLESVKNGIRISGAVSRADNDRAAVEAAQSALLELFAERAERAIVAPVPLPAVGAWAWPSNCDAIVAAADFSAVPGLGGSVQSYSGGTDAYYPPAEIALLGSYGPPICVVRSGDVSIDFTALGGARWAETEVATMPGATTLAVDGIDSVMLSPTNYGKTRVDAFDGPNWVTFSVLHASNAGTLAQALIAALDTTALS